MTRQPDVPADQRKAERAIVLRLLSSEYPRCWSHAGLVSELGDSEPVIASAVEHLRGNGVLVGEPDAIRASPCACLIDALGVLAI